MPLEKSNDPSAGDDGMVRSHRFIAANTAIPWLDGDKVQFEKTVEWMKRREIFLDIYEPRVKNGVRGEKYVSQDIYHAAEIAPYVYMGDTLVLQVASTNVGVGHHFPDGPIDIYESWIEVKVTDSQGKVVFWSGNIADDGNVDEDAHFFRALAVDRYGKLVDKHNLWDMVGSVYSKTIAPGETDIATFEFDIPYWVKGDVTVMARLRYRRFNQWYTNWALGRTDVRLPVIDMARDTMTIPVKKKREQEKFFGDIDNDGDIDIVINNNNEFANILKNDGGNNRNWLNIKLTGTKSNKNGIGAFVKITAGKLQQINEVRGGSSYLSQSDTRLHFGIGKEKSIDRIDIRWPSGLTQTIKNVDANQVITITEGEDKVQIDQIDKRVKTGPSKIIRRHGTDSIDTDGILQALKSRDPQKKKAAINSLKDIYDEDTIDMAIEPVIMTLDDPDKEVRKEAVTFFCKLFKEEQTILRATIYRRRLSVVPLLNLLNDTEPEVRLEAIKALGYSESYRAIIPVAQMLKDEDKGVRREAALALGHLRDRRGIDYLLDTLKNSEEDSSVRSGAILSLIRLESDITTAPIFEQMRAHDERTRLRSLETLKMALSEDESVLLKRKDIIIPVQEALNDQGQEIRCEALKVQRKSRVWACY